MSLSKKYNYDIDMEVVKELPKQPTKYLYILRLIEGVWNDDKLYINDNGKLKIIACKAIGFSSILLFLKKYRKNPELLPQNIKHDYPHDDMSSEDIYKAMKLMLKPMKTFEDFKERLILATKEIPLKENSPITKYGEQLVFINKKEDCGRGINIYGELIPMLQKSNQTYWEYDAVLFNKEKKILECNYKDERTNDTPDRSNWKLNIKFYEEQHLYEYLLNQAIHTVE